MKAENIKKVFPSSNTIKVEKQHKNHKQVSLLLFSGFWINFASGLRCLNITPQLEHPSPPPRKKKTIMGWISSG